MRNVPIGVVPSPSCRFRRRPLAPTRAAYGPPAWTQQPAERRQIRAVAYVVRVEAASTLISWREEAGTAGRRSFAAFAGHAAPSAAAASWATSTAAAGYAAAKRFAARARARAA